MTVTSIEQYLSEIRKINLAWKLHDATTHAWYRGQGNVDWHLEPTIYRHGGDSEYERELLRDFKLNSSRFLDKTPRYELEWLFIMQHYGISTRLLDWTENHLTALYFAVLNYKDIENAAVWVLDGWSLNSIVLKSLTIPTADYPALEDYYLNNQTKYVTRQVKADLPVAIRPSRNTPRIIAQKGVFTIHGNDSRALDVIIDDLNTVTGPYSIKAEARYKKNIIDGNSKKDILQHLMQAGISHSVLFPELEGLAKEINFRYSHEYIGDHGHIHNGF